MVIYLFLLVDKVSFAKQFNAPYSMAFIHDLVWELLELRYLMLGSLLSSMMQPAALCSVEALLSSKACLNLCHHIHWLGVRCYVAESLHHKVRAEVQALQ